MLARPSRRPLLPDRLLLASLLALSAMAGVYAQEPKLDLKQHYRKSEHMVPMRDGARLFTIIYEPLDTSRESGPIDRCVPFLPYQNTPFGTAGMVPKTPSGNQTWLLIEGRVSLSYR